MVEDHHTVVAVASREEGVWGEEAVASAAGVVDWVEEDVVAGVPVIRRKLALLPTLPPVAEVLVVTAEEEVGSSHRQQEVVEAGQLGRPIGMPWAQHWAVLVWEEPVWTWQKHHGGSS